MTLFYRYLLPILFVLKMISPLSAQESLNSFDEKVKTWAMECRDEINAQFNLLLTSGRLTMPQLFDTFYIPIPDTNPQKFRTQYDGISDGVIQPIIDKILKQDPRLVYVVAVDRNGYMPTHNSRFTMPLTGNPVHDAQWNRTKRIFNDRTGLAAARNKEPYLLQHYSRDTGEAMSDLSVPIVIQNRHWGAIRIGYKKK